jgi:predicted RNA-binding protein YlqC (UPF0109 family)
MIRIDTVAETIRSIVELMVKAPKCVRVTTETSRDTVGRPVTSFDIDVHETDRGRLIGRCGANIRALRVLLNSAAYVSGARYRVSCNSGAAAGQHQPRISAHSSNS